MALQDFVEARPWDDALAISPGQPFLPYPHGVGAQPEIGGQRWPYRRFQASLRETGMPRAVMRLSTLQPTLASTFCAGRVRARSVRPMMVL